MICLSCDLKNICTVFQNELVKHIGHINVDTCTFYKAGSTLRKPEIEKIAAPKNPIASMVDRNSVAERIRQMEQPRAQEHGIPPEGTPPPAMTVCNKCEKELPLWQAVEDAKTKQSVCEDCWLEEE